MRSILGSGALALLFSCGVVAAGCDTNPGDPGPGPGGQGGSGATPSSGGAGAGGTAQGGSGTGTTPQGGAGQGGGGAGGAVDCGPEIVGEGEPLASLGACGRLVYRTYANRGQDAALNRLPDFSYAGYEGGGVALPDVPVVVEVSPVPGDDRASIQAAIDEASSKPLGPDGFRGAVLLHEGHYEVGDPLTIEADGVVLRGEGQGADGTVLVATSAKQYTLLEISGAGSGFGEVPDTRTPLTDEVVPTGARTFAVEAASAFQPGDAVVVLRTPNQAWIDALDMAPHGWTPGAYEVAHERTIVAVSGETITIDVPIVDPIEQKYGGGVVYRSEVKGRVRHVGVEDLRLDSSYAGDTDEDHGWTAVRLSRARDSWVRRVTALHFGYSAVTFSGESTWNTVEDVAHLDPISQITGGRRYPFNVDKGTGNLFQRCYARNGRHNFVSGARVAGPNVWLDCLAEQGHADDGPHHRWATGLLFDNTKGESIKVQNRKDSGTGHGWSGAQVLFWNVEANVIVCDAPLGGMSWAIGCAGAKSEGDWAPEEPFGWWESPGASVAPRSLYLQQLQDRLGEAAVAAITVEPQRTGRIFDALSAWAGEGRLSDHLR